MEKVNLICIGCPLGCALTAEREGETILSVSGNTCPRGDAYARKELTDPTRIVTTTVKVRHGVLPAVSVKTAGDIPKSRILQCVRQLQAVEVTAPVVIGQVILKDAAGTGVPVIATKNVAEG